MKPWHIAGVALACAAAFALGRSVPRGAASPRAEPAGPGITDSGSALSVASTASTEPSAIAPPPRLPSRDPEFADRTVFAEWAEAVQREPDASMATHRAVLAALEARRRGAVTIRDCFRDTGVIGTVSVRFAVDVESTRAEVRVGNAAFVEVEDGPPVPAAAAGCLERELRGTTRLQPKAKPFLDGYRGRIEYIASFYFPP